MARLSLSGVSMEYLAPASRTSILSLIRNRIKGNGPSRRGFSLAEIDLDLHDGDRIGILGGNGAGKSTLLRVMAGIYEPLQGHVHREGKLACLFNLRAGMDPEATGFENIKLKLRSMGYHGVELKRLTAFVEDFSELGDALHAPVRILSAGMALRLAFSTSLCVDPDIFLIDESFGVGDHAFRLKAHEALMKRVSSARIVAFASHNMHLVKTICDKAIVLESGRIARFGSVEEVMLN